MKERIAPENGPPAVGPYSPALKAGGFVFVSGQIPIRADGTLLSAPVSDQVHLIMSNIRLLLETAGSSLDKVVKTSIFLKDLGDFQTVNEVYQGYFGDVPPARSTIQAGGLPKGVDVEIDVIALE
jgi:2-iminobutanoate/2-iminopropanoate deaminase